MPRTPPPLTQEQPKALSSALNRWVDRHPQPDKPVFGIGREFISPRQIAAAVNERAEGRPSQVGDELIRFHSIPMLDGMSFDDVIAAIDRSATNPASRVRRQFRRGGLG